MLKKLLAAALIASMLILPVSSVGPANPAEASAPEAAQGYLPGDVPAETDVMESMSPALHALVLAMLNHDATQFDFENSSLTWEGLYNMLSLYGQLDSRCDEKNGELFLPEETVRDYAAALDAGIEALGELPAGLRDRMNYDNVSRCYVLICGEDDQVQVRADSIQREGAALVLSGSLVDEVEGEALVEFQAVLRPRDNMFGYAVSALSIIG